MRTYKIRLSHDELVEQVRLYVKQIAPRPIVAEIVMVSYMVGYYEFSDGISFMHQLNFRGTKQPHPLGVGHDLTYELGLKNPWLPEKYRTYDGARFWSDRWFREGMLDFGHPVRGRVWYFGLRVGGNIGWYSHRRKGHPAPELLERTLEAIKEYGKRD